jgi:hypothetical protein
MISGSISAQSLVSNVERDSVVAKIIRGKECNEKLIAANNVIAEADKTIMLAKEVVKVQSDIIITQDSQKTLLLNNNKLLTDSLKTQKSIYKSKLISNTVRNFVIGFIAGGLAVMSL